MFTEKEARRLVIESCHKLVEEKLIARTWGNISARISDDEFVITPSGRGYETLKPDDLVIVRISDLSYEGDILPSSEKGVHAAAYWLRPDVSFIIHTHQYYASALAAECRSTEAAPCARYALPGTKKLIKYMSASIRTNPESNVFLMARHGALILGADPDEAFSRAAGLESAAKNIFRTRVVQSADIPYVAMGGDDFCTGDNKFAFLVTDRYVMECCDSDMKLMPYIDDFAMIVGPDAACADNRKSEIRKALRGRNAVLIKGLGAICIGKTPDDAEAVAMIVSKNAAAACYVREAKPLNPADARLQRMVYTRKYSRRK